MRKGEDSETTREGDMESRYLEQRLTRHPG